MKRRENIRNPKKSNKTLYLLISSRILCCVCVCVRAYVCVSLALLIIQIFTFMLDQKQKHLIFLFPHDMCILHSKLLFM